MLIFYLKIKTDTGTESDNHRMFRADTHRLIIIKVMGNTWFEIKIPILVKTIGNTGRNIQRPLQTAYASFVYQVIHLHLPKT